MHHNLFDESSSIDTIRFGATIDMFRMMEDLKMVLDMIIQKNKPFEHTFGVRRKLTMLNARCTIARGSPYDKLQSVEKYVDMSIRIWSMASTSRWADQLVCAMSFADDILAELQNDHNMLE